MIITFQRKIVNNVFACYNAFIKTSCPFGKFGGTTITQCSNYMMLDDTLIFSSPVALTLYSYRWKKLDLNHLENFD